MSKVVIRPLPNGSLQVEGEVEIIVNEKPEKKTQCFLCRCGHSKNKPFCDGTHKKIEFTTEVIK